MRIDLPQDAADIIRRLNEAGHRAYAVGGCVRDALLGRTPQDWDICTSALPAELCGLFHDTHVVETGLKHGTLTVVLHHTPYEITTFRLDGAYTDHRHPDRVTFVDDVREDLSRRDFTVNAMAYHPEEGLVDAFGGQEDLRRGLIRCVGDPAKRFGEDALRILRALRFASVYGFAIEEDTSRAALAMAADLDHVAAERIRAELARLLCGAGAGRILRSYADVVFRIIPELAPCRGFEQHSPHHRYDVWEHTVRAVDAAPPSETLRLAMLLHDSGKPRAFFLDEEGIGHAHGHQRISREIAEAVLGRLKVDTATGERVFLLVENHDIPLGTDRRLIRRQLNRFGEEALRQLIDVHQADNAAKDVPGAEATEAFFDAVRRTLDEELAAGSCYTLKQLAVHGSDLIRMGMKPGPGLGACLETLLGRVMDGELPNEREALLAEAGRLAGM